MASIGTIVPAPAAQWISQYLATCDKNRKLQEGHPRNLVLNERGEFDLTLLNVKELKRICKQMKSRTLVHNCCEDPTTAIVPIFEMPRSSAKKSQWIDAIVNYIRKNNKSGLYTVLRGSGNEHTSSPRIAASRKVNSVPEPTSTSKGSVRKSKATSYSQISTTSPAKKISASSAKSHVGRMSSKSPQKIAHKKSTSKNTHNKSSCTAATRKTKKAKSPPKPSANERMEEKDASMATSLQEQLYHEDIQRFSFNPSCIPFTGHSGVTINGNSSYYNRNELHSRPPPRHPVISSMATAPSYSVARTEMNRAFKPALHLASKPAHVKVKKEPGTYTTTSDSCVNKNVPATATNVDDAATPRNFREQYMASTLRNMGFTDMREILSGLRAVAGQREEICVVENPNSFLDSSSHGNEWSQEAQIEEAMMWIVTQREEAAEAQKLDEARISSENAILAMEQSRKDNEENQLRHACVADLIGSVNDSAKTTSRLFPNSILLQSVVARQFLSQVVSCESIDGKKQVVRLLQLEQKARKWYGTVLPYSYFEYVLCPIFKKWYEDFLSTKKHANSSTLGKYCQKLSNECDNLERSMFNLSEQEESGVGMAPKIFLSAQRDAAAKGKSTSLAENAGDSDDVEVIDIPRQSFSNQGRIVAGKSSSVGKCVNDSPLDIIEIL